MMRGLTACFACFGFLLLWPANGPAQESSDQKTKSATASVTSSAKPVYKPPRRGAPGGRIGGGTRGPGDETPALSVIAPEHTGLTSRESPALYWYISDLPKYPLEFTVIEEQAVKPIVETTLPPPTRSGIQRIRLKQHNVRLSPGVKYRWFVTQVVDSSNRSRDILSGGMIERVSPPPGLPKDLVAARYATYAETGFWYDAFDGVSTMIQASPGNPVLSEHRASLLEQIGLAEIGTQ